MRLNSSGKKVLIKKTYKTNSNFLAFFHYLQQQLLFNLYVNILLDQRHPYLRVREDRGPPIFQENVKTSLVCQVLSQTFIQENNLTFGISKVLFTVLIRVLQTVPLFQSSPFAFQNIKNTIYVQLQHPLQIAIWAPMYSYVTLYFNLQTADCWLLPSKTQTTQKYNIHMYLLPRPTIHSKRNINLISCLRFKSDVPWLKFHSNPIFVLSSRTICCYQIYDEP